MITFTGRNKECEVLNALLKSDKSELLAVYGRRRVGKTFMIREIYKKHIVFELTGLHNGLMKDQLENFTIELSRVYKSPLPLTAPGSWLQAFRLLESFLEAKKGKAKKVVFIDEFPWLATRKSKFLSAFEHFWNSFASKRDDLVVVVCGSAAAYMINRVIKNKGGLHNRVTCKLRLEPFTLYETELFLKEKKIMWGRFDVLQAYMVFGGIPHYLDKINKGESVAQAVDRLCFSKDGDLRDEFDNIFASLFENEGKHIKVVDAVGSVKKGVTRSQILNKTGLPSGGTFTKTIDELIESGFIGRYLPFKAKTKDALYRLTDEYTGFYQKFLKSGKSKGKGAWQKLSAGNKYNVWAGYSFESVCIKHISAVKKALGVEAVYTEYGSWTGKNEKSGAQVDLLIDRDDRVINLCEVKFSKSGFVIDKRYAGELRNKTEVFASVAGRSKNIHLTFITTFGVVENRYYNELVQQAIDLNQLFVDV